MNEQEREQNDERREQHIEQIEEWLPDNIYIQEQKGGDFENTNILLQMDSYSRLHNGILEKIRGLGYQLESSSGVMYPKDGGKLLPTLIFKHHGDDNRE